MAKTQNPSIHDPMFEEFTIPSLYDIEDGDRDKVLLCPIRTFRKYLSWTEQYRHEISSLFVSVTKKMKLVS